MKTIFDVFWKVKVWELTKDVQHFLYLITDMKNYSGYWKYVHVLNHVNNDCTNIRNTEAQRMKVVNKILFCMEIVIKTLKWRLWRKGFSATQIFFFKCKQ